MQPQTRAVAAMMSAGRTYVDKVRSYSPIAYWPLRETTGSVAQCFPNTAMNGAYTGATLANATGPDGNLCPYFDGAADFVNLDTAAFRAVFPKTEGSLLVWMKVANLATWTDGNIHYVAQVYTNTGGADEYIRMYKSNTNNIFSYRYGAGNPTVADSSDQTGLSDTDWMLVGTTWSVTGDLIQYIYDGAVVDTDTGIGTWIGNLAVAGGYPVIGASSVVGGSSFLGWLAHPMFFGRALTVLEVTDLASPF